MLEYIVKRLLLACLTLLVIMFVSYALLRLAPGDPTKSSFFDEGQGGGGGKGLSSEKNELGRNMVLRKKLRLDEPLLVGFVYWLKDALIKGDLGDSVSVDKGRPVVELVLERLPVTLKLNFWAILLTYLLAIPIGIYSAVRQGSALDKTATALLFLLYSLPSFWVALLLQAWFCEGGKFPFFPLKGLGGGAAWGMSTWQALGGSALHYVLPVFCLSYAGFAGLARFARAGLLETLRQDYIRTARAKGLPERVVVLKHALRNAVIMLITLFADLLPGLVGGSIIVEYVFSIPGMGALSMAALSSRDIPLLMALFGFGGALTLLGVLLSDVLYVVADPRISFKGKT